MSLADDSNRRHGLSLVLENTNSGDSKLNLRHLRVQVFLLEHRVCRIVVVGFQLAERYSGALGGTVQAK